MGQRRIDLHGLHGDVPLLLDLLILDGAHIVQPVRQLDHDDPDVLRHGDEHFAQVLHLLLFLGAVGGMFHFGELGNAVYQHGHRRAKLPGDIFPGDGRILHRIVEQPRHDGFRVQPHLVDDAGHGHRMHDIGLAAPAQLILMGLGRKAVGPADLFALLRGKARGDPFDLLLQRFHILLLFLLIHFALLSPSAWSSDA